MGRAEDVGTVDGIVGAAYASLSGPAGEKRDWERFRSLFAPEARLILALARPGEKPAARFLDVEAYIRRVEPLFAGEDFWEVETGRRTESFGNIAVVFSKYESRRTPEGEAFEGGTNCFQLLWDGERWWIVTVMWNTARP